MIHTGKTRRIDVSHLPHHPHYSIVISLFNILFGKKGNPARDLLQKVLSTQASPSCSISTAMKTSTKSPGNTCSPERSIWFVNACSRACKLASYTPIWLGIWNWPGPKLFVVVNVMILAFAGYLVSELYPNLGAYPKPAKEFRDSTLSKVMARKSEVGSIYTPSRTL